MDAGATTDEQLVESFQSTGDMEFVDELLRRYVRKVHGMIESMVTNRADAEDLTQEVLVRAGRGLSTFRGDARFSTWIYRIAMNTTRSFLRKQSRQPLMADEPAADPVDPRSDGPDSNLIADETDAAIGQAVASLSPSLRAAIVLTVVQGLDASEAARIEGCSRATIYWRIHQARKLLRERLEGVIP